VKKSGRGESRYETYSQAVLKVGLYNPIRERGRRRDMEEKMGGERADKPTGSCNSVTESK
jgi:hypothetical protein